MLYEGFNPRWYADLRVYGRRETIKLIARAARLKAAALYEEMRFNEYIADRTIEELQEKADFMERWAFGLYMADSVDWKALEECDATAKRCREELARRGA